MIKIVIGTEPTQYVAQRVLEYSIRKHASAEVEVIGGQQSQKRLGGTKFGFVRFLVPSLCGYQGTGIYMDADQVVLGDVIELAGSLQPPHMVGLVRDIEGTFAGEPVAPRNETSVMVLDCASLKSWDPQTMFDQVVPNKAPLQPGQIHYKDFMRLTWLDQDLIQPIDPRWNHYNLVREDTRLVHFSHVREQPWKRPEHPLTGFWEEWLHEAMGAGYLTRSDIVKAVALGRIHRHFLRHAIRAA
jgi:lipopolysaccharide biosynthesis glycosyltransferase